MKRPTGWVVIDGDTGWRLFHTTDSADFFGKILLKREPNKVTVYAEGQSRTSVGAYIQVSGIPVGYRYVRPLGPGVTFNGLQVAAPLYQYAGGGALDQVGHIQIVNGIYVIGAQRKPSPLGGGFLIYETVDPWPTTLPGTAA